MADSVLRSCAALTCGRPFRVCSARSPQVYCTSSCAKRDARERRGDLDAPEIAPDASGRMPLTPSGSKVLRSMTAEYGPDKGERVFYATANKKPALGKKWHGKTASSASARGVSKR